MLERSPVIWVVEAFQLTRQWKPIAAPQEGPFTKAAALKAARKMKKMYPYLKGRLRLVAYEQAVDRGVDEMSKPTQRCSVAQG